MRLAGAAHALDATTALDELLEHRQLTACPGDSRCTGAVHLTNLGYADVVLALGRDEDPAGADLIEHLRPHDALLLPGLDAPLLETLTALKLRGVNVAIVSTKLAVTIREIFQYNHADDLLDLIVGGRDVKRNKPDPEGLHLAMTKLGLKPELVLFCGDTVIDAQAAKSAGVDCCAVLNGTTPGEAFDGYPHVHIAQDLWDVKKWLGV